MIQNTRYNVDEDSPKPADNNLPTVGILIVDAKGIIESRMGSSSFTNDLNVGSNWIDWASGQDSEKATEIKNILELVIQRNVDQDVLVRLHNGDSARCELRKFECRETERVLVSIYDITALRADRRRLARALKAANMVWWEWDLEADTFALHAVGDCILGYNCQNDSFDAQFWIDQVHPDDKANVEGWLAEMRDTQKEVTICEHRYRRADTRTEKWEWVEEIASVISRRSDGSPSFVEGTTRNIHQRKLMEASVWLSRSYADEANRAREEFLTTVSHELRTPLNALSCATQLLVEEHDSLRNSENLKILLESIENLEETLDHFVEYSQAVTGGSLDHSKIGLSQIIEEMLPLLQKSLKHAKLSIHTKLPSPEPIIQVDEEKFVYVLYSIVTNAIHFSKPGGEIWIKASVLERSNTLSNQLELHIEDNGVGMNKQIHADAFESMYQNSKAENQQNMSTGRRLAVAREFIHAMGGEIEMSTQPDHRTRVTIHLDTLT